MRAAVDDTFQYLYLAEDVPPSGEPRHVLKVSLATGSTVSQITYDGADSPQFQYGSMVYHAGSIYMTYVGMGPRRGARMRVMCATSSSPSTGLIAASHIYPIITSNWNLENPSSGSREWLSRG